MKLIEALKQIKALEVKASDLKKKISTFCADMTLETPTYPDQKAQVDSWLQAVRDTVFEIERLYVAIQRTNLATNITIEVGSKSVTKSIAAWIVRRRKLVVCERESWAVLSDKGMKEAVGQNSSGGVMEIKIRRYYEPALRDRMIAELTEEPTLIAGRLEIANATTDLLE